MIRYVFLSSGEHIIFISGGGQTLADILARATKLDTSPVSVVEQIWDGKIPDVKPPVRKKLKNFVEPLRVLKKRAVDVSVKFPSLRS